MNNVYRLLATGIYPLIIFGLCFYIVKTRFKETFKKNLSTILINLLIISIIMISGLLIYFHFEDTVYVYDNAGYYVKSLEMLQIFWNNPSQLFAKVYNTINNSDYSYLPSLFNFYGLIINNSYKFYCVINYVIFLLPLLFLLELLYFKYYSNKILPIIIFVGFYPMWLTLFYGRVDVLGLFPLLVFYIIILFTKYEDISWLDTLILNILCLLLMFERRWYLYALVGIYLVYLVKTVIYIINNKDYIKPIIKFICSGILAVVILVLFFNGFIKNVMTVDNSEAYSYYNHSGKLLATINYYSIIISIISLFGLVKFCIKDKLKAIYLAILIVIPSILFWRTQSFDIHHYLIICLPILILFTCGMYKLSYKNVALCVTSLLIVIQMMFVFINANIPIFTTIKKLPDNNPYKEGLINLDEYLRGISSEEGIYTYVVSGNGYFCDDAIRNSMLPEIEFPNMVSYIFDVRDGFPRDFGYIRYFVITDPILYLDEDYQHIYKIISEAITSNDEISSIFELRKEIRFDDNLTAYVYEMTGEYTQEMKQYFYDKMLEFYPDKADFYSYILD